MSLSHLQSALWRNIHMRRYYKFLTVLEFTIPILIFHQGLNFRELLDPVQAETNSWANKTATNEWLKNYTLTIHYTPNNTFTWDILKRMNKSEAFVASNAIVIPSKEPDLASLKTSLSKELTNSNITNLTSRKVFGLEFRSGANDKHFRYTIIALYPLLQKDSRMLYSETFAVADSEREDEYLTSGFLGLQFALDKAFIEFRSSGVKNQSLFQPYKSVTVQKLPYHKNAVRRNPETLIYHLTLVGFVFLALTVPYYIATEKHSGMKEMMKMVGMSELTIWFGWITYSLMVYPFVTIVVVVVLKTGLTIAPFYRYVDPTFLWIIFILYCIANMTFLFAISTLITKHWVAVVVSMIVCFLTAVPFGLTRFTNEFEFQELVISPFGRHILLCLVPNLVMYNALKALQYFEMKEQRTGWSSIVTDIKDPRIYSLRTILAYFVANIILNSIILMYANSVRPGRYGDRKHPLFFVIGCLNLFRKKERNNKSLYEDTAMSSQFIETVDEEDISIQIVDLQKTFGYFHKHAALKNINLNVLKGEITVILGHNGAGKSTLLNVICGMSSKTSGEMFQNIDGDLVNTDKLIGKVGFCPQQIIYFNYLTVEEHILFFGMARGMSQIKATKEAHYVMSIFDMQEKSNNLVYELSGGMRRKLGLLIALIGRSEILILDEPTNGMDVNSRRITWDLLKKLKKNRVIIMTTQDMEEADIIGNRIAIMHNGQIFCYGSPNFLKELFGTGYNLTLSKGRNFDMEVTKNLITGVIPSASVTSNTQGTIEFNLPLLSTGSFPYLFKRLEEKMSALSVTRIQMFCTTMDQVFLNVTFLARKSAEKSIELVPLPTTDVPIELRTGLSLLIFQIFALFMKRFKLTYRRHNRFLSCILLAIILGYTNIAIINWTYSIFGSTVYPRLQLTITMYKYPEGFIFFSDNTSEFKNTYSQYFEDCGGSMEDEENVANITEIINKFGDYNLYELRDNLIGAVILNSTEKRILYNELIPHSAPILLNVYSTSLLRYTMKNTTHNDSTIEAEYLPISLSQKTTFCTASDTSSYMFPLFWWIFIYHSAILALFVFFISFMISERVNGIKHIQTMSNLSEFTYWVGNFIYDYVLYVVLIAITVVVMKITDTKSIITSNELVYLIKALLLYGVSGLLYCYVYSSICESISIFMLINVVLNISCLTTFVAMQTKGSSLTHAFKILTAILPSFSFLNFLSRYLYIIISSNHCVYCLDFEKNRCEETTVKMNVSSPIMISDREIDSPYTFLLFLMYDVILYGILLMLLNSRLASWFSNFLVGSIFGKNIIVDPNDLKEEDKFVIAEKEYLKNVFHNNRQRNHALMVHNLKKNLIVGGFHKFTAVADVNFFVDKSSCFGIVGINGAGKSTTFKILTAFLLPTEGDAKVHNVSLRRELGKYTSMIGSCPQSNTTFEELTGREMLHLTASLRGLKEIGKHVEHWISVLNMENFQDNLIETYSSGGKRKLCVALSLIGDPKVVFLDEPTSGVDPVGRQYIYQIIKSKKLAGQAVVVASHNMKECEILCDRVTVLHNGVLKRIGSITALKKQYASGFTLVVKLRLVMDYSDRMNSIIDAILNRFRKYRCVLRDQRVGLLQFRILGEEILWSQMFGGMEEIKRFNLIVEEYIITNATIAEEIFISSLGNPAKTSYL